MSHLLSRASRLIVPLALLVITNAAHSQQLYGLASSTPSLLYTIDAANGAASNPVTVTNADGTSLVGLAYLNGTLYASDVVSNGAFSFGTLNPTTGAFTVINNQGGSSDWQALTPNTSANLLYVADLDNNNALETVTPTGTITTIGFTGHQFEGLAYNNATSILYGMDTNYDLYTLDTSNGVSTLIGSTGLSSARVRLDLALDANGTLFLNDGVGHNLYTVNTSTAALTLIGSNGVTDEIDGLAFTPAAVPEPGSVALLLGMGTVGAAFLRRRKQSRG